MARILFLSNGHGEDLSGALIGKALQKLNHQVDAMPFVGFGDSYQLAGIRTLGKTKEFSTGGLGYTSWYGRVTELIQGQLFYLVGCFFRLFSIAPRYDLLVVIGDVVPVTAAWLTGLPVVTYLVAYSSHYEGKLKLPWPCASCLSSQRFLSIYTRDELTADDLTIQLSKTVEFLGNPFMDSVATPHPSLPSCKKRLGLLPGSRRPELDDNMALVPSLDEVTLRKLAATHGWKTNDYFQTGSPLQLVRHQMRVNVYRDSFAKVLQSSDVLLCMAGTAAEQAIGLGKPVVQLQGHGPQFTAAFAEAQRRLLGPTIFCAEGQVGEEINLKNTSRLIFELLDKSQDDFDLQRDCQKEALRRLGRKGGARRIAIAISKLFLRNSFP